jgi:hypothetical protein
MLTFIILAVVVGVFSWAFDCNLGRSVVLYQADFHYEWWQCAAHNTEVN